MPEPLPRQPPRRYTVKNRTMPRRPRQKLTGFRALYVYYLYLLGVRKPAARRAPVPFSVRKEVTKLNRYAAQDDRIRVISQENRGLGGARNRGFDAATGEFILFVDSDDWIDPAYCERLYEAAHPIWEQCHDHPFVRGIGDGSLDLEKFRWFLLQDYLYLFDYARVFAYGVVKARDPGLMRTFSANVDAILGGEMKVHRAYMARLGITEEQVFSVQPALSNLSYTHYMLSCAAAGGPAEIIAAILSCSWSYAEIGTRLAAIPGAADHPFYGEWIRSYAGEDYQKTNDALVELMDTLAESCTEAEYQRLEEIFVNCSRYELGFWEMAWTLER